MEKDMFLINEVAKLHNLSKKTLLHYDKIGIFCPHHCDPETGYRYYVRQQFPYLKQIIYLKKLGLGLDTIEILLKDREFESLIDTLQNRLCEVDSEINELLKTRDDLRYLINHYERVSHIDERDLYRPNVKLFNERRVIYELCDDDNSKAGVMLAYRSIIRKLMDTSKFSQMPYGTICMDPCKDFCSCYQKIGSFVSIPHSFGFENETVLPAGKYITMYKKGGYYDKESVTMLMDWIIENGYKPVGYMFDFCIVDYTFTRSESEMIQELQIRVE